MNIKLTAPILSNENIDHHVVCIRPKRVGGARIEQEIIGNKFVIHNYGHGGFGWSLLPGSVLHTINLFEKACETDASLRASKKITIIGSGCMGLLTAIMLAERGYEITVITEQTDQLTSHKAAGSVAVIAIKASHENQPLMDQMAVDSYRFYQRALNEKKQLFSGIEFLPVYMIHEGTPHYRYPLIKAGVTPPAEKVTVCFNDSVCYPAKKHETFFIDTRQVMQQFYSHAQSIGITFKNMKVTDVTALDDRVLFNCAGLGGRAWDPEPKLMVPVQGYTLQLKNQPPDALKYILYAHIKIDGKLREISLTPKGGGLLGGTVVNYEERLDTYAYNASFILERARIFFGGRKNN